jgi:hypothetical protein
MHSAKRDQLPSIGEIAAYVAKMAIINFGADVCWLKLKENSTRG